MLGYDDANPDAARDRALKGDADRRLIESLLYLCEVAEKGSGRRFTRARDGLEKARSAVGTDGGDLRGIVYVLHSRLLSALRAGDETIARRTLDALATTDLFKSGLDVWGVGGGRWSDFERQAFRDTMSSEHEREYKLPFDARPPDQADLGRVAGAVSHTLAQIEALDAETYHEFRRLVSDVVIIKSEHINAGTSFRAFGVLLLRELGPERVWTTYLENLVHEAAHLHLFLIWSVDPVIENEAEQSFSSPLRPGGRPLSAIYHAMFVLARTIRAVNIFRRSEAHRADVERMSTSYNYAKNPAGFEQKFRETYETVKVNARLTPLGSRLLESCREMALGS